MDKPPAQRGHLAGWLRDLELLHAGVVSHLVDDRLKTLTGIIRRHLPFEEGVHDYQVGLVDAVVVDELPAEGVVPRGREELALRDERRRAEAVRRDGVLHDG